MNANANVMPFFMSLYNNKNSFISFILFPIPMNSSPYILNYQAIRFETLYSTICFTKTPECMLSG